MDKKEVLFSLISPVYNMQKYVAECIESVISQSFGSWELILVDDGSRDDSCQIISTYVEKDSRIFLYRKKNNGVSTARNLGLEHAKGKYVMFLDSDDFLQNDFLEKIKNELAENKYLYFFRNINMYENYFVFPKRELQIEGGSKRDIFAAISGGLSFFDLYYGKGVREIGGKLFLREIIVNNNIIFPTDIYIGEDAIFILRFLECIDYENIIGGKSYGYIYRRHNNSATMTYREDLGLQYNKFWDLFTELVTDKDILKILAAEMLLALSTNEKKAFKEGKISKEKACMEIEEWVKKREDILKYKSKKLFRVRKKCILLMHIAKYCSKRKLVSLTFLLA